MALQAPVWRLLALLRGDHLRALEAWRVRIPEAVRQRIWVATADLKRGDATVLARGCPPVRVVADPYHVSPDANARLDAVRRWSRAKAGSRFPAGR
ncbi:MAG: transposase [Actinomycetia bacterium]|nr:transposase [Actinomycetes bacterium]